MTPIKRCEQCGAIIAQETTTDYYRYIRLKYCPACADDVHRRQKAAYARRLRAQRREQHRLEREHNKLLTAENELLRDIVSKQEQRIKQLRAMLQDT